MRRCGVGSGPRCEVAEVVLGVQRSASQSCGGGSWCGRRRHVGCKVVELYLTNDMVITLCCLVLFLCFIYVSFYLLHAFWRDQRRKERARQD